jgi:hypothetical protein
MMQIETDAHREYRSRPGLRITDGVWQLDADYYEPFIEAATGISVSDDISPSECYRIGNSLESFIEDRKAKEEWNTEVVKSYPVVESLEEIFWVARFFRECHRCELNAKDDK